MVELESEVLAGFVAEKEIKRPVCLRKALGYCQSCDKEHDVEKNRLKCDYYTPTV